MDAGVDGRQGTPQSALFVARTPDTREPWYESSPQFRELRPMIRNIKAGLKMCFCAAKQRGRRNRPSYGLTKVWPRVPRGVNKLVPRVPRGVPRSEKKADKNKLAQNKKSPKQMFKEKTFSSYKSKLDFSSDASTCINPKPIFIIPVLSRCNHALHISIFFQCEYMHKSKNHFLTENHLPCKKNPKSAFTHFQNIISVLDGSRHALTILQIGESIYLTLAPF